MRRLAVGLLTACALAAPAAPAAAERVDRATYLRLVNAAAASDGAALSRLRGVTAVDGRPVELRRVLTGSPARVNARLEVLRAALGRPRNAGSARRAAAAILAGDDYRTPRAGLLARALSWLARRLSIPPGADGVLGLVVLAGAVAAVAGLAALALGGVRQRQRHERVPAGAEGALGVGSATPEELDRRAAAAEAAGRFEDAMRLRLAGALTRLDVAGAIRVRRDTTLGQVARSLGSPSFDAAADGFSGVVYGRRTPTARDAADLRSHLAAALDERART